MLFMHPVLAMAIHAGMIALFTLGVLKLFF